MCVGGCECCVCVCVPLSLVVCVSVCVCVRGCVCAPATGGGCRWPRRVEQPKCYRRGGSRASQCALVGQPSAGTGRPSAGTRVTMGCLKVAAAWSPPWHVDPHTFTPGRIGHRCSRGWCGGDLGRGDGCARRVRGGGGLLRGLGAPLWAVCECGECGGGRVAGGVSREEAVEGVSELML